MRQVAAAYHHQRGARKKRHRHGSRRHMASRRGVINIELSISWRQRGGGEERRHLAAIEMWRGIA